MSRVALVTGSSRGIGREVARQLAARGDRVIITSRNADDAAKAAVAIGSLAIPHALETSDPKSVESIVKFIEKEFGRLDVLVNNAAILLDEGRDIDDVGPREFEDVAREHLRSVPAHASVCAAAPSGQLSSMSGCHPERSEGPVWV